MNPNDANLPLNRSAQWRKKPETQADAKREPQPQSEPAPAPAKPDETIPT
jgi:hypothetical protein